MHINFRIVALDEAEYRDLFDLSDEALNSRNAVRQIVDKHPGYPCRVSLQDAEVGEEVLLISHAHHQSGSPYRASGPVYIRKGAAQAKPGVNEIPKMLEHRLLSLRAYTREGMMMAARTVEGAGLRKAIQTIFQDMKAEYIHIHNAAPGCYNCQVNRA